MKNSPIIAVLNSKTEQLITERTYVDSKTGEEGTLYVVQLEQNVAIIGANNRIAVSKRVAYATLDQAGYEFLSDEIVENAVFPMTGKLVVVEQLTKRYDTQKPKINPTSNEILKHQGQLIYRSVDFVADVNAPDVLLATDKVVVPNSAESIAEEADF